MSVKGIQRVRRNLKKALTTEITRRAESAMHQAAALVGGEAALLTPVDLGTLINSQYRTVVVDGMVVRATIGYTAQYAAAVHEAKGTTKGKRRPKIKGLERGMYWAPDGEPKFLKKAGDKSRTEIGRIIKRTMSL